MSRPEHYAKKNASAQDMGSESILEFYQNSAANDSTIRGALGT